LNVSSNGIHCEAKSILLYWWEKTMEYIVVLKTDLGYLVETGLDFGRANEEYIFLCLEDEAAKQGIPVTIVFFNFTLYDNKMEQEINHKGSKYICELSSAA
jgi:hypothetical protein